MSATMRVVASLVAVIVVGGCSDGNEAPAAPEVVEGPHLVDALALVDLLAATELGCDDAEEVDPLGDHPADGVHYPLPSAARCSTALGPAFLFVYRNAEDRSTALAHGEVQSAVGLCEASTSGELGAMSAGNWRIVMMAPESARLVVDAVGHGTTELVSCLFSA